MSKITKTKEAFGWLDGYLATALDEGLEFDWNYFPLSTSESEWVTFQEIYGSVSFIGAINAAGSTVGGSNLSDIAMPTSGTPAVMDKADGWFNVTFSSAAISGFGILDYVPDEGEGAVPLRYFITLDDGEVSLRDSSDPDSTITVYSVSGAVLTVDSPVCYIYASWDGGLGEPILDVSSEWDNTWEREYILLYCVTLYDAKPIVPAVLLSISIEAPSGEPASVMLGYGSQLIAWGTYEDVVDPVDITSQVTWTSDYESTFYVSVNETGLAYGESEGGTTLITAALGAIEGTLAISCIGMFES